MARVVRGVAAELHERCDDGQCRPCTRSGFLSCCTGLSTTKGDGDRAGSRRRALADIHEHRRTTTAEGASRPIRGVTPPAGRGRPIAFPQLLAFGFTFDGKLSDQCEDRAAWCGGNL